MGRPATRGPVFPDQHGRAPGSPWHTEDIRPWDGPPVTAPARRGRRAGRTAVLAVVAALSLGTTALVLGVPETAPPAVSTDPGVVPPASAGSPAPSTSPDPAPQTSTAPQGGAALQALATLPVKGRAAKTGYDRDAWDVWSDFDGNGCDERQDTLARDLTQVQRAGCQVVGGILVDPYTAATIVVPTADPQIDIDHVVSLSDAWQKGAQGWSPAQMQRFAADPLNLLAVSSSANRSKSDGDAATWLPANTEYRCPMVARQIAVKAEYGLWVTPAERAAMERVLASCPDEPLPVRGSDPAPVEPGGPLPKPDQGEEVVPGLDPRFPSCRALAAAGYQGNYVKGVDPEYDWYRDGDGDGVVCE